MLVANPYRKSFVLFLSLVARIMQGTDFFSRAFHPESTVYIRIEYILLSSQGPLRVEVNGTNW